MTNPHEDVLLAFAVEPAHDRTTLERYLGLYPQYAEHLIDLLHELRLPERDDNTATEDEATFQRALTELAPGAETQK